MFLGAKSMDVFVKYINFKKSSMRKKSVFKDTKIEQIIEDFAKQKNISKTDILNLLEDSIKELFEKYYNTNVDVFFDPSKIGSESIEVWVHKKIVPDEDYYENDIGTIPFSKAKEINPSAEIDQDIAELYPFENFSRTDLARLMSILSNKIVYKQYERIMEKYEKKLYQLVVGEVFKIQPDRYILYDEEKIKVELPKNQIIPTEAFRIGEIVKAVPIKVEIVNNMPKITLSRTSEYFLLRLLEQNVIEIVDKIVEVKKIVREPGLRAKVVVETNDDRIDPVMACVGPRGSRINPIVRELRNENIDVIRYSPNLEQMVRSTLAPAKILDVEINEEEKKIKVMVKSKDVPLAIGKGGANINLSQRLLGYTIEIYKETEEVDIPLRELNVSIPPDIMAALLKVNCETARDLINLDANNLAEATGIPLETIKKLKREVLLALEEKTASK